MKRPIFRGSATALVTPFFPDGSVDFDTLGQLIDLQICGGTDALVPCGTTGESATMTEKERLSVIEYTVWKTAKRVPVIAGTGTNCTAQSLSLTKRAEALGADGILAVCPYYNKPTQEGILAHYLTLAEGSSLPLLVYNVPSRTGCEITVKTLKELSSHPNIAGVKQANPSLQEAAKILDLCGDDLPLYAGDDGVILPFLALGGQGVVSVAGNILPRVIHTLCEKWFSGDCEGAARDQIRLMPLISALFCKTNPIPVKAALEQLGFPQQTLRLPLTPLGEEDRRVITAALSPWLKEENDEI